MQAGWHLAHADSRNDFVIDPVGYVDFASNLEDRLKHLVEQVQAHRYGPRHLLDIDLPKSGLSVRPGNVLPIEEAVLLHSITYLLAPLLDKRLDQNVYSYRLHPDWKKRVKKGSSLFREAEVEFPFLKRETIRSLSPFDAWYELWPEFEQASRRAFSEDGYTHLTKTDISAYFENIDLRLLETQIRSQIRREEDMVVQLLFRILNGWTRMTSTGTPVGRGIPQGNEVSSFLGNLYLIPLDRKLNEFKKKHDAKWFRYVDDVMVFTHNEADARQVVFVINDALRALHLNLQGSKTEIIDGEDLSNELDNTDIDNVNAVFDKVKQFKPHAQDTKKQITRQLRKLSPYVARFSRNPQKSTRNLSTKQNRLFRRLMTVYGFCGRPHLRKSAMTALEALPDLRILEKALTYLSQLDYKTHNSIVQDLFGMLDARRLPFPYQIGSVLETISLMHPERTKDIAMRARKYGLSKTQHWYVKQKALETIAVYPCQPKNAMRLANRHLADSHPMVRRAACLLLVRGPKVEVQKKLMSLIYHPDPNLNRLALYFLRLIQDSSFAQRELSRITHSRTSDLAKQRMLPSLYAMAATDQQAVAGPLYEYLQRNYNTRSPKLLLHRDTLIRLLQWTQHR